VTIVLARELGASAAEIGVMFTISGAGGFAGALAAPWLLRHIGAGQVVVGYAWVATAATYALLAAQSVWLLGIVGAVAFFPVPTVNALVMAQVALNVPDALHGRVFSATTQLTTLLHPVGPAIAGLALQTMGSSTTVMLYGALFTLLALLASASPVLRAER
jgi:predicted MFS family arabinose efflux permease